MSKMKQIQLWDVPLADHSCTYKVEAPTMEEAVARFKAWAKVHLHTAQVYTNGVVLKPLRYLAADTEPLASVDVDGHVDDKGNRYLGKAYRQENGMYRVMAEVNGALCIVEANLRFD